MLKIEKKALEISKEVLKSKKKKNEQNTHTVVTENKLPAIVNSIIFSMCLNTVLPGLPLTLPAWKYNIIVNIFSK